MTSPVITARGLALAYDGRPVLTGVDVDVRRGEFWFVVGPNGAGKSTLLHAIVGMLPPRAGTLRLDVGREHTGFVPQRCDLNRALPTTVREFVLLGTVGLADRHDEAVRLDEALERAGLRGMAMRDYWSLSGGQRQRALLARALVRRPRLLLLDEPTNHLDPGSEEALLALLARLNADEGVALVVVTHDLRMAARHATHVALVAHGRVRAGTRETVLTPAALREAFGEATEIAPA